MERIQFGLANIYDSGHYNSVVTNERFCIEVHNSESSSKRWYHIGWGHKASIEWGQRFHYSEGFHPSTALNTKNTIVEVHETDNSFTNALYTKVGLVKGTTIEWLGNDEKYDTGVQPNIAINDYGALIEVRQSEHFPKLYCRMDRSNGINPNIAVTNDGRIIEVYELVVIDDDRAVTNQPKNGFWLYPDWQDSTAYLGDLTIFIPYSNSINYNTTESDPFQKFKGFNSQCSRVQKNGSWECLEFSKTACGLLPLSWTLTPPTGIWLFVKEAYHNPGRVMSHRKPHTIGYFPNILYPDNTQYARPTFIVELLTKVYNSITHRSSLPKEASEMAG